MDLRERQQALGAHIAPDGVPLHFGDTASEYAAGIHASVLMDRSHEARVCITGEDRLSFLHNITTNDLMTIANGEGRGTVLTQPNARIIDRFLVYNRDKDALLISGPGRGQAVINLLKRNIFFNDDAQPELQNGHQFVLHGPMADSVVDALGVETKTIPPMHGLTTNIDGVTVFIARRKPISGSHWTIVLEESTNAITVWDAICEAGAQPAGAIAYNMLRIQAGAPAHGREIHPDYLPLEVGLWDEVSFTKGCYTGQEIIARMESRARLARVMVRVTLSSESDAPIALHDASEREIGRLTSSVTTTSGEHLGIAVIKNELAEPGAELNLTDGAKAIVKDLAGAAPPAHMLKVTPG